MNVYVLKNIFYGVLLLCAVTVVVLWYEPAVFSVPSLTLNRSAENSCAALLITRITDRSGQKNNINIFNIDSGENVGTQLFDPAIQRPPYSVCRDFGFNNGTTDSPIGFLPVGRYAVLEHGPPYSGACDGQASPREFNYGACRTGPDFISEAGFVISSSAVNQANSVGAERRTTPAVIRGIGATAVVFGMWLRTAHRHLNTIIRGRK